MARKEIAKSIRMTEEVFKYVEGFHGNGFNEKFENLVLFCLKEEKSILARIKEQKKTEESNQNRLKLYQKVLTDLGDISLSVSYLLDVSKSAEVVAKGVQLKMRKEEEIESAKEQPRGRGRNP